MRAVDVLKNNIKGLTVLAELLLEKEVIFSEDLERIFGKRKADLIKEAELEAEQKLTQSVKEDKAEKADNNDTPSSEKKVKNKRKSDSSEKGKNDLKKPPRKPKVKE